MKKVFICIFIVFYLASPCLADQTIYCPKNSQEAQKECKVAKEKIGAIQENLQRWTPMVDNPNMVMYKITRHQGESNAQYLNRAKSMKSFYYKGLNYPVRGMFTKNGTVFIPLTRAEAESVLDRAFQSKREVKEQMKHVQLNTGKLKPMIRNKINRLKQDEQHYHLFLAQCCGYRWTNEVGNEPEPKPVKPPEPNVNLKDVELLKTK